MIRLLMFLLNKPYETCKSCETLKQQLDYERSNNKELTDTLLRIVSPKAIEASPVELTPINQTAGLFSRRRAALEARDREEARILQQSKNLGKPDFASTHTSSTGVLGTNVIEKLEQELGIEAKGE